jgi:small subunit ribosomal protein S1
MINTTQDSEFAKLLENSLGSQLAQEGDIVIGSVVQIIPDSVIVDFGHKSEGLVPRSEFLDPVTGELTVKEGDEVEVYLEQFDTEDGFAVLSKEKAVAFKAWDKLQSAADNDEAIDGMVIAKVKGGLSVDIGVKAFLPASQIDIRPVTSLDHFVGKRFHFKILKLNKRKGNIILSRRVLLEKDRDQVRKETLQNIVEGNSMHGTVKNITDYGAFVDLGGVDGLLHIKDMSWGRLNHPSEICQVGDDIHVQILNVDKSSGKVSLGFKQLSSDPWEGIEERYPIGSNTKAKVVNIMDYGAFLELEDGVEGLAHVSEMTWTKKAKPPSKLVEVGQDIEVMVLDIDRKNRRISLGMKQLLDNPWEILQSKYSEGDVVAGVVRNVTDFGVFIGLDDVDIDGLVHVSDISWTRKVRHPQDVFRKGDKVRAIVLAIDTETERFSLGIKQLVEDPWPRIREEYQIGKKMNGTILGVTDRGLEIEVEPGVEGIVPKSALTEEAGAQIKHSFDRGQTIAVILHSIDERERRIAFGLVDDGPLVEKGPEVPEVKDA